MCVSGNYSLKICRVKLQTKQKGRKTFLLVHTYKFFIGHLLLQGMTEQFNCLLLQPDRVTDFCKKNKLQLIIRAHECVMDGFERFAQGQLITLFSATNYCGKFKTTVPLSPRHFFSLFFAVFHWFIVLI